MPRYTYEEAVRLLRSEPGNAELIKLCYFDEDNSIAAKRFAASEEFGEVKKLLGLKESKLKVLDLGCGNGIAAYAFASLGHDVTAVDPDPSEDVGLGATVRLTTIVDGGTITTQSAFAESLPFSDATFDIVYERQALHHFGDLSKGLAECARVLKPGGLMLATREHIVDDEQQLATFLEEHALHKWHGGENAYPLDTYLGALEKAGLKLTKCFAPFDTVINYFPMSRDEVRGYVHQSMYDSYGRLAAGVLIRIPFAEKSRQLQLSRTCNTPGRLYSFLCSKESRS